MVRKAFSEDGAAAIRGTQTLMRGLQLLECIGSGMADVKSLSHELGIPRSTTHRTLASLMQAGYLRQPRGGRYVLGPKLIELGRLALDQRPLQALARPALEDLACLTRDTIHLGARDGTEVFYLDKIPGSRGLGMRSHIGGTMPIASTGVGRALMMDLSSAEWHRLYDRSIEAKQRHDEPVLLPPWPEYEHCMSVYAAQGWVMDLEENEPGVRCVAAPVRDQSGTIIGAVSVASTTPYMPEARMQTLGPEVIAAASRISRELE